jgi:hypothetical protein
MSVLQTEATSSSLVTSNQRGGMVDALGLEPSPSRVRVQAPPFGMVFRAKTSLFYSYYVKQFNVCSFK